MLVKILSSTGTENGSHFMGRWMELEDFIAKVYSLDYNPYCYQLGSQLATK